MFNEYALQWALGFLVIYLLAQLAVSKLSFFQSFSPIQKSITVKLLALLGFVVVYGLTRLFSQWSS